MEVTRRNFLKTAGILAASVGLFDLKYLETKKVYAAQNPIKFFRSAKIDKNVTRIRNCVGDLIYLVEGKDRAALIDSGIGVGDLKSYVKTLTDKPVIVLLTHGHVDHASGSAQFEEVYMNQKDNALFREHTAIDSRKGYVGMNPELAKSLTWADTILLGYSWRCDYSMRAMVSALAGEFEIEGIKP